MGSSFNGKTKGNIESDEMGDWGQPLIEKIFAEKQKEKSEDRDNLLRLTSRRLYGEKIHYALELIQNAEDESSSSVTFIFDHDHAVVVNDGRPFDEKDVWRICSVRPGEKKRKIGFFGIGFKSVFNITENPQIISNGFNFEIENYIYPKAMSTTLGNLRNYYSPERGTIFVLPYSTSTTAQELIENFNMVDDKILLFLENLKELKFVDNINTSSWVIKKNLQNNSTLSLLNTRTGQETGWKVFHHVLRVENQEIVPEGKEGIEETRITIAFPLDNATREVIKKTGVVYCYLPTKKRTDLSFLIQADFLPTIGRENIAEHQWNLWLTKELGVLAAEAIDKIKEDEQASVSLYDFIPLSAEVADPLIRHLFESFLAVIRERPVAKTTKGWAKPVNCVIPVDNRLRNILLETDLKLLFGEEVFYIEPNLSQRAQEVLLELGARPVGPKEVIDLLKIENEVAKKTKEWFLNLYEYLTTVFDTTRKSFYGDFPWDWDEDTKVLFGELENAKFVLTDDNKLIPLKNPTTPDRLLCYPERIDLSEVHQLFTEGEIVFLNRYFQEAGIAHRKEESVETEEKRGRVKEWFDSIGVKKYFKQTHIIREVILPKFKTGKYKHYADSKLYDLIDYIRRYWPTIESEIKNKKISAGFVEEIRDTVMLKAFSFREGKKLDEYKNPGEIYFSRRYRKSEVMEELFEGIDGIYFVSSYYLNREKSEQKSKRRERKKAEYTWRRFFEILQVWRSPRVVKEETWVSIRGKEGYEWLNKEYSPSGTHEIHGDSRSADIERLIGHCSKIDDQKNIQRRMRLLWLSLERHWKTYKEKYCRITYKWFYYSEQSREYETSSFLEFLRSAAWVLGVSGGFFRPIDVFIDIKQNRLLLEDDVQYVSLEADATFLKDIGVRTQPEIGEVIDHLKSYKAKNPHLKKNKIEKMSAIYAFLRDRVISILEADNRSEKIKEIQEIFNKNELFYLPREDKVWWKPTHVFWKDYSNIFETFRGYVEHHGAEFYNITLKEFFSWLGIVEKPLAEESLDILEELKEKGNVDLSRRIISKTYTLLNEIAKQGLGVEANWSRDVFLSEKGNYSNPSKLYYSDSDEYKEHFGDKLEILWLPFSWFNAKEFLNAASFRSIGQNISIVKKLGNLNEIEGDAISQLIQRVLCVENYLKKKNFELYDDLQKEGVFRKIKELQAFETPEIVLDYLFKVQDSETITVSGIKKDAYLSIEENRIYKSGQTDLFSTCLAKELSKLFVLGKDDVFPFLDSLFGAHSEEQLNEKLKHFGIQIGETMIEELSEEVKIIPRTEGVEQENEPENEDETSEKPAEETSKKPQLPESEEETRKYDLINPDEFIFDTIEEHTPYVKTEGAPNMPTRTIRLKAGHPGSTEEERTPRERISRRDAEAVALEVVMRFEEIEGRVPDDRHKQQGIGYDIYSKTKAEEERFVEVKHFRGEAGTWELTPHQWKKAEAEKDRYFVYVVSRLKEGSTPILQIIQDPIKYLTPDPPIQKKFSDWKNGVVRVIKCEKV